MLTGENVLNRWYPNGLKACEQDPVLRSTVSVNLRTLEDVPV